MRRSFFAGLMVPLVLSGACAGRSIKGGADDENGGATTAAGTPASSGGTTNTGAAGRTAGHGGRAGQGSGGTLNRAGAAAGGAVGVAGSTAEAGAPLCGGCDPIACGDGFRPVLNADGCCFHCECSPLFCPLVACPSGSRLETQPGQCCPTCFQDDCAQQRASYRDFESQLVEKYSYGCVAAKDCSVYYDKSPCGTACGVIVATQNLENLRRNLEGFSQQNCSSQCAGPTPPCDPPSVITCAQGRCQ
jgi:hypothetical protein